MYTSTRPSTHPKSTSDCLLNAPTHPILFSLSIVGNFLTNYFYTKNTQDILGNGEMNFGELIEQNKYTMERVYV